MSNQNNLLRGKENLKGSRVKDAYFQKSTVKMVFDYLTKSTKTEKDEMTSLKHWKKIMDKLEFYIRQKYSSKEKKKRDLQTNTNWENNN